MRWFGVWFLGIFLASCGGGDSGPKDADIQCNPPLTNCGGACIDVNTSPLHCGMCNNGCTDGLYCSGAQCVASCNSPLTSCSGACVDLASNHDYCGTCSNHCTNSEICRNGACRCPDGQISCGGVCVDPETDVNNCGRCGRVCDSDEPCVAGDCTCPVGSTESACTDGVDNDCDGNADCADTDCRGTMQTCTTSCGGSGGIAMTSGTGTKTCGPSGWGNCILTATEICGNNVDENCDGVVARRADEWEAHDSFTDNNSCATRTDEAFPDEDPNDVTIQATIDYFGDVMDCYSFMGDDSSWDPTEDIIIELTNIPSGHNYDLLLYKLNGGDCGVGTHSPIAQSSRSGNTDEDIDWSENAGLDDTGEYMVCVKRISGENCTMKYSLYVDGLSF